MKAVIARSSIPGRALFMRREQFSMSCCDVPLASSGRRYRSLKTWNRNGRRSLIVWIGENALSNLDLREYGWRVGAQQAGTDCLSRIICGLRHHRRERATAFRRPIARTGLLASASLSDRTRLRMPDFVIILGPPVVGECADEGSCHQSPRQSPAWQRPRSPAFRGSGSSHRWPSTFAKRD